MGKIKSAIGAVAASVVFLTAPAAATAAVGTATASCTTSAAQGECGPYDSYPQINGTHASTYVGNDVWNQIPGWQQTLTATDPGNWGVSANMPAGNTAVVSYPSISAQYGQVTDHPTPLSDYASIYSSFAETMNATPQTSAWAAYDIWLGPSGCDPSKTSCPNNEVMIQHDFAGNGSCTTVATATFGGSGGVPVQTWHLCQYGSELIWKLGQADPAASEQSGSVDVLAMLNWLVAHGYMGTDTGLWNISYGWEICSTGGVPENFRVSGFTLTPVMAGGGGGTNQAPAVTTNAASSITSSGATLNGSVNPEGQSTTYQFDYGTTTGYGTSVPSPAASAGSGTTAVSKSQAVSGLRSSTTYHYRVEATNAAGTSYGPDHTFTTSPTGNAVRFDATARAERANASTLKWTHTVGASGTSRALLVEATVGDTNDVNCHQTVKDGSVTLKKLAIIHTNGRHAGYMDIWGLANPRTGANSLSFTVSGCDGGTPKELTAGSISFTRVNQSTPFSAVKAATGDSAAPTATIASTTGNLVAGFLANGSAIRSATSPSVSRFVENEDDNTGAGNSAGATSVATGSKVTMGWAVKYDWWGEGILQVNHA